MSKIKIGVDTNFQPTYIEPKTMGHILIGGRSGSGKTTLVKNLVEQFLDLENTRVYIIDPKRIDFVKYADQIPIVTEAEEAEILITELVALMENRYQEMAEAKTDKCAKSWQILIIDEFAALNTKLSKKCLMYLERLLQMGRAANVRVIIGTQRPDARTISPQIKANITTTIALQVATASNSRVLLDDKGAEMLEKYHAIIRNDEFRKKEITLDGPIGQNAKPKLRFVEE